MFLSYPWTRPNPHAIDHPLLDLAAPIPTSSPPRPHCSSLSAEPPPRLASPAPRRPCLHDHAAAAPLLRPDAPSSNTSPSTSAPASSSPPSSPCRSTSSPARRTTHTPPCLTHSRLSSSHVPLASTTPLPPSSPTYSAKPRTPLSSSHASSAARTQPSLASPAPRWKPTTSRPSTVPSTHPLQELDPLQDRTLLLTSPNLLPRRRSLAPLPPERRLLSDKHLPCLTHEPRTPTTVPAPSSGRPLLSVASTAIS